MHELIRAIKVQDFVEGARFNSVLSLLVVRRSEVIKMVVDGLSGVVPFLVLDRGWSKVCQHFGDTGESSQSQILFAVQLVQLGQ